MNNCQTCGHSEELHTKRDGYKPYGSCNFQHDLCNCTKFVPELVETNDFWRGYKAGLDDMENRLAQIKTKFDLHLR